MGDELGKKIALELYRLEHTDIVSCQEACALLGCAKSTLYKKNLPHNNYGWKKQAILDYLSR